MKIFLYVVAGLALLWIIGAVYTLMTTTSRTSHNRLWAVLMYPAILAKSWFGKWE